MNFASHFFPDIEKLREAGACIFCKKFVNLNDFRDELSKTEYKITGLCQVCQDRIEAMGRAEEEEEKEADND